MKGRLTAIICAGMALATLICVGSCASKSRSDDALASFVDAREDRIERLERAIRRHVKDRERREVIQQAIDRTLEEVEEYTEVYEENLKLVFELTIDYETTDAQLREIWDLESRRFDELNESLIAGREIVKNQTTESEWDRLVRATSR